MEVDYSVPFQGSDYDAWEQEYKANIEAEPQTLMDLRAPALDEPTWDRGWIDEIDPTVEDEELEMLARAQDMSPDELDELYEYEVTP